MSLDSNQMTRLGGVNQGVKAVVLTLVVMILMINWKILRRTLQSQR